MVGMTNCSALLHFAVASSGSEGADFDACALLRPQCTQLNALLGKLSGSSMQLSNSFDQFLGNKVSCALGACWPLQGNLSGVPAT